MVAHSQRLPAAMEMEFKYRIWGTLACVVFFFPAPPCSLVYFFKNLNYKLNTTSNAKSQTKRYFFRIIYSYLFRIYPFCVILMCINFAKTAKKSPGLLPPITVQGRGAGGTPSLASPLPNGTKALVFSDQKPLSSFLCPDIDLVLCRTSSTHM